MTGFIILDKPEGITSFSAAGIVRRLTGTKKVGHTGTLDPMATGVLPIAVGHATKFIDLLPSHDKGYIASFKLGITTDTLDITGKILSECKSIPEKEAVIPLFDSFKGTIEQTPPMYSAIQIGGKRLYDLARQGMEIEREKRTVTIHSLELLKCENGEYTIAVKCSKGTYIRSLIDDIGALAGCGAVMTRLRRTLSNGFELSAAHTEHELKNAGSLSDFIIPVDSAFIVYPMLTVSEAQAKRFSNGGCLDAERIRLEKKQSLFRVYSPEKKFLGLGEYRNDENSLVVKKVFVDD